MSESKLHYLNGFVTVDGPQRDDAASLLGAPDGPVDAETVLVAASGPLPDEDSFRAALEPIDGALGFVPVDDPRAAVEALESQGIRGSLIHAVGYAPHWSYSPGTDPVPVAGALPEVLPPDEGKVIGVVDSGIMHQCPSWLLDYVVHESADEEVIATNAADASHGTFIAGLLRQLACDHRVSMARLQIVDHEQVVRPEADPAVGNLTTELHLLVGIIRLVKRHEGQLAALNLSLGTYTATDLASLIMEVAIAIWNDGTDGAPVFAAAGNEFELPGDPYSPFYPAALPGVVGVGAADESGAEVVWDYHAASPTKQFAPAGQRPWVNRLAPGTDLISEGGAPSGLTGQGTLVQWSGSSFATSVALALALRGVAGNTAHGNVDGLPYVAGSGPMITPWPNSPCFASEQAQ
jgi:hypothetical protein